MKRAGSHSELPLDPDVEVLGATRPLHFRPGHVFLVGLGGVAGTAARYGVALSWVSPSAGFPAATFAVNLVGSFLLGVLLEALVRHGPDDGYRRRLRLLIGTGFCGGFTTYSTLAMVSVLLVRSHHLGTAAIYDATSVIAGLLASILGIAVAGIEHRSHRRGALGLERRGR